MFLWQVPFLHVGPEVLFQDLRRDEIRGWWWWWCHFKQTVANATTYETRAPSCSWITEMLITNIISQVGFITYIVLLRAEIITIQTFISICIPIVYKLGVMTYGCQHGKTPQYLANYCTPVSDVPARQRLRSSSRHLDVPRHRLRTYDRRAFSVANPSVWNSLPVELRDADISIGSFRWSLKTWLLSRVLAD